MAKVTSGYFTDDNAPELRFEDPNSSATALAKRAGNHVMPVSMPASAYGVEDDRYAELQDKQTNMVRLQHELERTRREARELELRRAKEERFSEGRREIMERLARNLAKLERELYNAQVAVQEISGSRETYHQHLEVLRSLAIDASAHSDEDMDRAIGAVEDAENEFAKTSRRLASVLPKLGMEAFAPQQGALAPQKFRTWLLAGAALSLPLAVAALLVAFLLKHLP
jgi:hypothetical protein